MSVPDTISTAEFAALAKRSKRRIEQLAADGVLPKIERGKLAMPAAMHALLVYIEAGAERAAERHARGDRVREARAREIELRIAEREGRLIPYDEAVMILQEVIGAYRSTYDGLGARVTRDLEMRRRIKTEVDACQDRVSRKMKERAAEWKRPPEPARKGKRA